MTQRNVLHLAVRGIKNERRNGTNQDKDAGIPL
jgi:hypothetical protein